MGVIGFDLEIMDELDESGSWKVNTPRIACIGATTENGSVRLWYDEGPISQGKLREFVTWLWKQTRINGDLVVTANGACFDFPLVWHWVDQAQLKTQVREIAMNHHVDMLLAIIKDMGYGVSLDNMAEALGVPGKTEDLGKEAPRLWREGHYQRVLEYLGGDCLASKAVHEALVEQKLLTGWRKKPKREGDAPQRSKAMWTPLLRYDHKKGLTRLLTPLELWYWKWKPQIGFEPWDTLRYYKWRDDDEE
jgi:hypothetical protein